MRTPVILALHLHLASVAPDVPHAGPARAGQTAGPWSRTGKLVCPQKVRLECTVANGRIIPEYTWRATDHECSVLDPDDALEISLEGDSLRHLKVGGRASLRKSSAAGGGLTLTWEDERGPTVARLTRLKDLAGKDVIVLTTTSAATFQYEAGADYIMTSYRLSRYECYPG
jgi:hypothetical protein